MDPSSLPVWAQGVFYTVIALGAAITAILGYAKKQQKDDDPAASTAGVISASFIDSKLLRELIEAMRELQDEQSRDAKKSHRLSQDLREAVNELNESIIVQTDTSMNLVRFIQREVNKNRVVDVRE
jgi:hypothetical protein